jgi:hypothetical protein
MNPMEIPYLAGSHFPYYYLL